MSSSTSGPDSPSPSSLGRIEGAIYRLFMKSATVRESRALDERFRLVTIQGESLRGVKWTPGEKVQMAIGGWITRTYTPLSWDPAEGSTKVLVFLHGEGPGAAWGRALKAGEPCTIFGPRQSLDLGSLERPALVFGDETSFALVHSLRFTARGAEKTRVVLEVASKSVAAGVLDHLEVANVDLVERTPDDSHLGEIEAIVASAVQAGSVRSCALTGKAPSIQRLNKRVRALGLSSRQIRTRPYWAPGKTGLD